MEPRLVALSVVSILLTACATTPSVTAERRSEIRARAQECMRAHPEVLDYEVDRFGTVTRTTARRQAAPAPPSPSSSACASRSSAERSHL
jgi:hypothetical protein